MQMHDARNEIENKTKYNIVYIYMKTLTCLYDSIIRFIMGFPSQFNFDALQMKLGHSALH